MYTTLNKIREHSPCTNGWETLLRNLNKTKADDEPVAISYIVESNGVEDAIWCLRAVEGHDREIRLFAVFCARQVQHLLTDQRSVEAIDVAERYANGEATEKELWVAELASAEAASYAASWTACAAACAAAWAARGPASDVAWAARDAAWATAPMTTGAAQEAALNAQEKELLRICKECEK